MRRLLVGIVFFAVLPLLAAQATELGRLQLNGKTIILIDDGTWRYADAASPQGGCAEGIVAKSTVLPLSACFHNKIWKTTSSNNVDFELLYARRGGDMYGG